MNISAEKLVKPSIIIEDQNLELLALFNLVNKLYTIHPEFWEDKEQ